MTLIVICGAVYVGCLLFALCVCRQAARQEKALHEALVKRSERQAPSDV